MCIFFLLSLALPFADSAGAAVPSYRPNDPLQVVLKLNDDGEGELARLHRASAAAPADASALTRYVQALVTIGTRTGNERYFGFAEQAIADAPPNVRNEVSLLYAQLLQHRHDFRASEKVLSDIIDRDSRRVDALLMRAQVRLHLHDAEGSLHDCAKITLKVDLLTSMTCAAQAKAALSPELVETERGYALITNLLQTDGPKEIRSWSAGVAAEFAARLGNVSAATRWYRTAYELDHESHYARIAYADWLLSRGDFESDYAVAKSGASSADTLRAVLAKREVDSPEARQLQLLWREAESRGERTHLRDQARFELIALNDTARAHATAIDNFQEQREAEDALLLAQTAAARGDKKALALLREWQVTRRYADVRLDKFIKSEP